MELHHKLIQSTEDGDLMLALNADRWIKGNNSRKQTSTKRQTYFKIATKKCKTFSGFGFLKR